MGSAELVYIDRPTTFIASQAIYTIWKLCIFYHQVSNTSDQRLAQS
jgi:hypothetical protein